MRLKATLALILANVIWGAASPLFKWSLENIPPFTLAFLRFSLASFLLLPFISKDIFRLKRTDMPQIILFALSGITINITFFFWGLKLAPSVNAAFISTTQPLILLLLGAFLLQEKVEPHEVFGTIVSFTGVLLIILIPLMTSGLQGETVVLGNLFFVLATLGAVGQAYFGKKLFATNKSLPITFWSFTIGAFTFLPFFLWEQTTNPSWVMELGTPGIVGIFYGAIFSSALAYSFYDWGLSKIEASETGIFSYLMPITSVLVAILFFGEKLSRQFGIAAFLIILGITVAQIRLHKKIN